MVQLYRLILIGVVLCVAGPARGEMLQFATPDGMKSWPKLNDPPDWHQDQESSQRLNANFLIPDGVDPAKTDVAIEARGVSRINNSLSQMLEKDRAAAAAGTQVKQLPDVADKDGTPFNLYAFAPPAGTSGGWKAIAYSEEGDTLLAFTLNARSQAVYESNFPVFVGLVQKYAKDIPW